MEEIMENENIAGINWKMRAQQVIGMDTAKAVLRGKFEK